MKKLLSLVTALALTFPSLAAYWTDPSTGIEWKYYISDGKATVGSRNAWEAAIPTSTSGAITIPSTLGGYPVTTIGDDAFLGCSSLTSVTILEGVTTIGDRAFEECRSLTSVTIPSSVTTIGYRAFIGCKSLTSVTIPEGVTTIDDCAFDGCSSLTSVTIPEGVATIGKWAFCGCISLMDVTIPSSVTSIEYDEGEGAFDYTGMYNNAPDGVFIKDGWVLWVKGTCPAEVVISNGVRGIAGGAFDYCRNLTSVTIPEGVTTIGEWAFIGCKSLTSVTIPASVVTIGEGAFKECHMLQVIYVAPGNKERVKQMIGKSGFDVRGLKFKTMTQVGVEAVEPEGAFSGLAAKLFNGVVLDEKGAPVATIQVKSAKANNKGEIKLTITVINMDGKKSTGKATATASATPTAVPVAVKNLGTLNLLMADNGFGAANDSGQVAMFADSRSGGAKAQFAAGDLSMFTGVLTEYLPNEAVTRTDKKWKVVAKAGKLKYNKKIGKFEVKGDNIGALKLTYAAKAATFKGSFKVWTFDEEKKKLKGTSAKITGIVAAGDGYGKAVVKKTEIGKIVVK